MIGMSVFLILQSASEMPASIVLTSAAGENDTS